MEEQLELEVTSFSVRWEHGRAIGIVNVVGDIDLATIPPFKSALVEAAGAEEGVVIDLSLATYMDSSGFSTLLEVNRILRPLGLPMFLVGQNPNILRMLEITRLNSIFEIGTSVDEAVRRISSRAAVAA